MSNGSNDLLLDDGPLCERLAALHDAARGSEFDLVPADGPIARLTLFIHEHGDRIVSALRTSRETLESAACEAEADHTPGYGTPSAATEWMARTQREDIARRIRALKI